MEDKNWTKQIGKGTYEFVIMKLLSQGDMYGYEVTTHLNNIYGFKIAPAAIYPILKRLQENEWIDYYWAESKEGPKRKYYHITSTGEIVLEERRNYFSKLVDSLNLLDYEVNRNES